MTKQEARTIYRQGEAATVEWLLKLTSENKKLARELLQIRGGPEKHDKPPEAKPSDDDVKASKAAPRQKRRKKRGRKNGHPGSRRAKPERVDQVKEHKLTNCPICQRSLRGKKPCEIRSRYIEEIPQLKSVVIEHQIYRYKCNTCGKIVEKLVTDALPKSTIGLMTLVQTCWMHYALGIPTTKIVRLINTVAQLKVTASGLFQAWFRLAMILKSAYEDIGEQARNSRFLHADETGWSVYGINYWLWCLSNPSLAYYDIVRSRGSPAIKKILGEFPKGILLIDFWNAYNCIVTLAKQRCLVHLFRELIKTTLMNSSQQWCAFAKKLSRLLWDAIRLRQKSDTLTSKTFEQRKIRIHTRLQKLINIPYEDKDCKRLVKRLRRHQKELFVFLDYPEVDWHNNHAERQLRMPVVARKNSGGNQSEQGSQTQAVMMSIFFTLHLRKENEVDYVLNMLKNYLTTNQKPKLEVQSCSIG